MQDPFFIFSYPSWWLWIDLLISAALSWVLYSKKGQPWSPTINLLLATIRFTTLFLVIALFLHPLANLTSYEEEKPSIVIAVDNSTSIALKSDTVRLRSAVNQLMDYANSHGLSPMVYNLKKKLLSADELRFDENKTDLNWQISQIERDFENQNLAAIVLLSDGIVNEGFSPTNTTYGHPIYTIGLGDTLPPTDISVREVNANNIVYQGNQFVAEVLLSANGFTNQKTSLRILKNGREVAKKTITIQPQLSIEFILDASTAGMYGYTAVIDPLDGDVSTANDQLDFYVDVIDGKENILIVAPSPHPDIRAIRSALRGSENYQTFLYIPGITELRDDISYDVIIYHQAFDTRNVIQLDQDKEASSFYIISSRPIVQNLASLANINLSEFNRQTDEVTPALVDNFTKFTLAENSSSILSNYPSINVPFGEYQLSGPQEVLLYQQVGSILTSKPLLTYYDDGASKMATLMGTGIWKWRLQEAALTDKTVIFDALIRKTVQYLSIRNDKRKFRITPSKRLFEEGQRVTFHVELYNEVYERISDIPFQVTIQNEDNQAQSFDFVSDKQNALYALGSLPSGRYSYQATATSPSGPLQSDGAFIVATLQLETQQQQANHNLLRQVSNRTGGIFYTEGAKDNLIQELANQDFPAIIHTFKDFIPLRHSIWILGLILLLAFTEWFLRKYMGSY